MLAEILLQVPIGTETIDRLLEANAQQITGVIAVIVGLAILVLLYAQIAAERNRSKSAQQQFTLMSEQIKNNTELIRENALIRDAMAKTNEELHRQSVSMDDSLLYLGRIDDTTKLQLMETRKIALSSEQRIKQNDATNESIGLLRKEFADGKTDAVKAVTTHLDSQFDTQRTILQQLATILEGVKTSLEDGRASQGEKLMRIDAKLDEALALLTQKSEAIKEDAPP